MSTPSQTVGPFLSIGLPWEDGPEVVPAGTPGAVWIRGTVSDGAGQPVPDALVETWQADADGRFDHPDDPRGAAGNGFRGFGRCPTDSGGQYQIRTVVPGAVPGAGGLPQAPHIDVSVLARGLLHRVVTRIYFEDKDNSADQVLALVPEDRRHTLIATKTEDGYRFDVRLQGEGETVFFDV
ncbi:protocatechuate 3,4-dioxygenase alpha subunit [Amycolatopsis xylanica]|uniref:Protocatechuate 3,4-dioxygenase alpha subunit n=1 Tax=Amycolatopsis xylanica TaxID=589385 RepID=A0A1H3QXV2_9PSEU|nr:protocatechuate 3,4-dioxygenase subunit alpha [Amycolatopsis xylanica]SDZ18150.1 protocatechuate 3,4-dioxygenase alpha subunit [Amycolatopsis xylanica]